MMLSVPSVPFRGQAVGGNAVDGQWPGTVFSVLQFTCSAPTPSVPSTANTVCPAVADYGRAA